MSALRRELEPEVMDTDEEALDYDAMDHAGVNARFVAELLALGPPLGRVLDVGTGTARIPIELVRQAPAARVVGVDLASAMLAVARKNVARAGLGASIELVMGDSKGLGFETGAFGAVICNTIVHHIPEPGRALAEMARVTAPGGVLFVRDLLRPESEQALAALVALHAAGDTPRQRALFEASLRASLTLDEARETLASIGLPGDAAEQTSDRHWTLAWRSA